LVSLVAEPQVVTFTGPGPGGVQQYQMSWSTAAEPEKLQSELSTPSAVARELSYENVPNPLMASALAQLSLAG
jgi:hypothetical protein